MLVVTCELGNVAWLLAQGWARHATDSPFTGVQRTPTNPLAPVLLVRSTTVLLPLLESLTRLAMIAACGRSSACSSTLTSVTIVRVLPRAVAVARTHSCLSLLASYAGWLTVSASE